MRKHKHLPHFTKRSGTWPVDANGNFVPPPLRRAHRLTPRVAPPASVLERAASRRHLYQHSMARGMEALRKFIEARQ